VPTGRLPLGATATAGRFSSSTLIRATSPSLSGLRSTTRAGNACPDVSPDVATPRCTYTFRIAGSPPAAPSISEFSAMEATASPYSASLMIPALRNRSAMAW
jgi:hypothetical protein